MSQKRRRKMVLQIPMTCRHPVGHRWKQDLSLPRMKRFENLHQKIVRRTRKKIRRRSSQGRPPKKLKRKLKRWSHLSPQKQNGQVQEAPRKKVALRTARVTEMLRRMKSFMLHKTMRLLLKRSGGRRMKLKLKREIPRFPDLVNAVPPIPCRASGLPERILTTAMLTNHHTDGRTVATLMMSLSPCRPPRSVIVIKRAPGRSPWRSLRNGEVLSEVWTH